MDYFLNKLSNWVYNKKKLIKIILFKVDKKRTSTLLTNQVRVVGRVNKIVVKRLLHIMAETKCIVRDNEIIHASQEH